MKDFLRHINLKNQKFNCYLCTDDSEKINLTVNITNRLNYGAKETDIKFLKKLIRGECGVNQILFFLNLCQLA